MYWSAPPHTHTHMGTSTTSNGCGSVVCDSLHHRRIQGDAKGARTSHGSSKISLFLAIFYLIFIIQHPGGTESCIRQCSRTHPGGTDLERGYGDVRPWRPPFHASPAARKGPISRKKRVSSQNPLLRKFGNFSLYGLNFHPNFSSQAPKFGNFQLTSPQIWKFSAHKLPFSEANVSSQAPHFGNPGRTPLPEKRWVPPPGRALTRCVRVLFLFMMYTCMMSSLE